MPKQFDLTSAAASRHQPKPLPSNLIKRPALLSDTDNIYFYQFLPISISTTTLIKFAQFPARTSSKHLLGSLALRSPISTISLGSEQSPYFQVYLIRIILWVCSKENFQSTPKSVSSITTDYTGFYMGFYHDFGIVLRKFRITLTYKGSCHVYGVSGFCQNKHRLQLFYWAFFYCNTKKVSPNSDK